MSKNILDSEVIESTISDMPKNIAYCILSDIAGFFWSRPGIGKSEVFKQIAHLLGYHLIDLRLSQIEAIDLRGIPTKVYSDYLLDQNNNIIGEDFDKLSSLLDKVESGNTEEDAKLKAKLLALLRNKDDHHSDEVDFSEGREATVAWAMPDFLVEARMMREKYNKNTIFLFDELNHADDSNQAAAYQFILEKKIGCFSLHEDDRVFAAGNYEGEGSIANPMSLALANRMNHYYIKPDAISWCKWARENDLEPIIISFVEKNPDIFDDLPEDDGAGKDKGWPTPRTMKNCSDIYNTIVNRQDEMNAMFMKNRELDNEDFKDLFAEYADFYESLVELSKSKSDIFRDLEINLSGAIGQVASNSLMSYIRVGHELPDPKLILSGEIKDFGENVSDTRIDIQAVSSNQCISALYNEYKNVKAIASRNGVKKIFKKSTVEELENAKQDFYKKYDNLIFFCSNNYNKDLFILTIIIKIVREYDIVPSPIYNNIEAFKLVHEHLSSNLSRNF